MSNETISRRNLLKGALIGIAAAPAATLVAREAAAQAKPATPATPAKPAAGNALKETDPQAKALAYHLDAAKVDAKTNPTFKKGQHCANCIQYTGKAGATDGPCNLFPGRTVKAAGWCKVWVLKPGMKLG